MRQIGVIAAALLVAGCAAQLSSEANGPTTLAADEPASPPASEAPSLPAAAAPKAAAVARPVPKQAKSPPPANGGGALKTAPPPKIMASAPPSAAGEIVKETTTQGFARDVIEESRLQPVLVNVMAPWCGHCTILAPRLEKIVRGMNGKAKLVKLNIDEHPSFRKQLGIENIPTVIAYVNGQAVDRFTGAFPDNQIILFLDKQIKSRTSEQRGPLAESTWHL